MIYERKWSAIINYATKTAFLAATDLENLWRKYRIYDFVFMVSNSGLETEKI